MEQDQIISRLQKENNIIESIRQSLEQQLAQAQQTITEKDTQIQSMQGQLSDREHQIEQQRQHLSQDSEAKLILQQQINSLKAEIDKLKLSKPTPRCVMQIEGNLITTETASAADQSTVLTTHFSQEIDPIRTEGSNYPYIHTEEDQRTVRPPHAVQNAPSDIGTCLLRERLRESLRHYPEIQLLESVALPVAGKTYSFLPASRSTSSPVTSTSPSRLTLPITSLPADPRTMRGKATSYATSISSRAVGLSVTSPSAKSSNNPKP